MIQTWRLVDKIALFGYTHPKFDVIDSMLDLNAVALFVNVVRYGSFAEAARRTGIPPNTLSRRVQQLEEQLGTRLLQRSTRKLTLTSAGDVFSAYCAVAVNGLNDAAHELQNSAKEPSGLVRVAAPADFFDFFQMDWVSAFLKAYPLVQLDFVLSDAKADLIADKIDLAFRAGVLQDSSYISRQVLLGENFNGLVASPTYLAARGNPTTLQDLALHDCVCFSQPGKLTAWRLLNPKDNEEEVQVTARMSGNTIQALRKAAIEGIGIALLPYPITKRDLDFGLLVPVLPQYKQPGSSLHVVYPSRRQLPMAVSALIAFASEKLNRL